MAADDSIYRSAPSLAPTVLVSAARIVRAAPPADSAVRQRTGEYPRPRAATGQPRSTRAPRTP